MTKACDARQYGDEMKCGRCGLSWDMNDPEPPACAKKTDRRAIPERRVTREVARRDGMHAATALGGGHANGGPFIAGDQFVAPVEGERRFVRLDPFAKVPGATGTAERARIEPSPLGLLRRYMAHVMGVEGSALLDASSSHAALTRGLELSETDFAALRAIREQIVKR